MGLDSLLSVNLLSTIGESLIYHFFVYSRGNHFHPSLWQESQSSVLLHLPAGMGPTLSDGEAFLVVGSAFAQATQYSIDALGEAALPCWLHTQAASCRICGLACLGVDAKDLSQDRCMK